MRIDASDRKLYNSVYLPYITNYDYKLLIFFGGSSSGKSKFVSQRNILNILGGDRNYLICRKVGSSIRNTVFAEYKKSIIDFGLSKFLKCNETDMSIKCVNGFQMIFKGLDDPEKLKSLIFPKGLLTDIHIEEATDIGEADYNQLTLRLRGKYKDIKKQIVMSFNPISQLHWIKARFFDEPTPDCKIVKTTYKDNAFLADEDVERIESYKEIDPYYYDVYALGNWGVLGDRVYSNWEVKDISDMKFDVHYYGLDFGFSNCTAIVKIGLHDNKIYILDEIYQKEMTNARIVEILKVFSDGYVWCDCNEPKSIKELRSHGVLAMAAKKPKDSVRHGIQWIRQRKIYIAPHCKHFIEEIQQYKYPDPNKLGIVVDVPIKVNDHLMDAMRYALEQIMLYNLKKLSNNEKNG